MVYDVSEKYFVMDFTKTTIYDVDIESARTKLAISPQDGFDQFVVISVGTVSIFSLIVVVVTFC